MAQLSDSNITFSGIKSLLKAFPTNNISLSTLQVSAMGSSDDIYANIKKSRVSVWNVETCKSSKNEKSTFEFSPGANAGLNPTQNKASPNYTGWVYDRVGVPWRPTSVSEFKGAADAIPQVKITKEGVGDPGIFTLKISEPFHRDKNGFIYSSGPLMGPYNNTFYVWVDGPTPSSKWTRLTKNDPVKFANRAAGTYKIYVQDGWGAGNQFEISQSITYPGEGVETMHTN